MSRYIDADKMLEICTKFVASVFPNSYEFAKQDAELLVAIEEAEHKTIDIVRCKECYMCDEEMWCSFYDSIMESDDYCSYGDRKSDE